MQSLNHLLSAIAGQLQQGSLDHLIATIEFDSRKAKENTIFVCIVGSQANGHKYVAQAYSQGCRVFVTQEKVELAADACVFEVLNTSLALAQLACTFFGNPSKDLKLIGVTGTNGKTTTATLLHELFTTLGYKAGLLSTVVNKIEQEAIVSTHTTPDPVSLNALLRQMVEVGCTHCFMEVSSHAIDQHRIGGLHFAAAGFTNITHDHLDYHHTFAAYLKVKKAFFDNLDSTAFALVNADDKNGSVMLQNTKAQKRTYALRTPADYKGKIIENSLGGLVLQINGQEVHTRLVGAFNASNLLLVYGLAVGLGEAPMEVLRVISQLTHVAGRFQYIKSAKGITAIIDYAHTPDALENVLSTIAAFRKGSAKVLTVVGCGGDRDKEKRPKMAAIAAAKSNQLILTSDNPRSEDPAQILRDMEAGLDAASASTALSVVDRRQAIQMAIMLAQPGDIILVAGKGHETYQEIQGVKTDFDDVAITQNLFNQLDK
ncbi:MAG: UDP-N-acetylmuramoyl-L-alanyl-D-glutamate--2,6-diaminopimelate ligase [Flavobacteriales bacterium]